MLPGDQLQETPVMFRQQLRDAVDRGEPHLRLTPSGRVLATGESPASAPSSGRRPQSRSSMSSWNRPPFPEYLIHFLPEILEQLGGVLVLVRPDRPRPVPPIRSLRTALNGSLRWARIGIGGLRPPAGLKPIADQIRRMSPFGSPKRGRVARPNETKRRRRRVVQVDPPYGGTDARVHRPGRWRGSVAAPASGYMDGPASRASIPAADRASRGPLNGFPGALAGVLRHRIGGGRRRPLGHVGDGLVGRG